MCVSNPTPVQPRSQPRPAGSDMRSKRKSFYTKPASMDSLISACSILASGFTVSILYLLILFPVLFTIRTHSPNEKRRFPKHQSYWRSIAPISPSWRHLVPNYGLRSASICGALALPGPTWPEEKLIKTCDFDISKNLIFWIIFAPTRARILILVDPG